MIWHRSSDHRSFLLLQFDLYALQLPQEIKSKAGNFSPCSLFAPNSPTFLDQPASHSVSYLMVVMIHFPPSTYRVNWLTHKKPSQANPSPAIFDKSVCYYLGCDCLLQDKTEIASWREYGLGQNRKKALSAARSQPSSCSLQKGIQ